LVAVSPALSAVSAWILCGRLLLETARLLLCECNAADEQCRGGNDSHSYQHSLAPWDFGSAASSASSEVTAEEDAMLAAFGEDGQLPARRLS
jgi:hypothetical protein